MTVLSQHSYFYNVSPSALENIAIVILHDLIIICNIRFLNGTLALTWMFFYPNSTFGWLLSIIWVMFLVKVAIDFL